MNIPHLLILTRVVSVKPLKKGLYKFEIVFHFDGVVMSGCFSDSRIHSFFMFYRSVGKSGPPLQLYIAIGFYVTDPA